MRRNRGCPRHGTRPGALERADDQSIPVRRSEGLRVIHRDGDVWGDHQLVKLMWEQTAVEPVGFPAHSDRGRSGLPSYS